MTALWLALGKIGGLALIGGLIDLAMRRSEKDRLNDWLIKWWDRFDSVEWSNFGRKEAELAVELLDRIVASRLWSWKRWRFVLTVCAGTYVLMLLWTMIRLYFANGLYVPAANPPSVRLFPLTPFDPLMRITDNDIVAILVQAVSFALSFSLTRALSQLVIRVSVNSLATVCAFLVLIALQLFFFQVWTAHVVPHLVETITGVRGLVNVLNGRSNASYLEIVDRLHILLTHVPANSTIFFNPLDLLGYEHVGRLSGTGYSMATFARRGYALTLDYLAFLPRILLSFVFLGSFLFRPLIQAPSSRLWAGMIDAKLPVFATVFGTTGAIVTFIHSLTHSG